MKIATCNYKILLLILAVSILPLSGVAGESYSPYVGRSYPTQVYWGDTHVHTSFSSHDANVGGKNRSSPEVAYRFARGEVVEAYNGMAVKLHRPLDFLVVADHAEGLGVAAALQAGDPGFPDSEVAARFRKAYGAFVASSESKEATNRLRSLMWGVQIDPAYRQTLWQRAVANAEKYNDPGRFTAFAGFEWSAAGLTNLHRVVIFKDGADKAGKTIPFSQTDSDKPEDLWAYLDNYQTEFGGSVIAIPHNSNLSYGQMFAAHKFGGDPLTIQWARLRSEFEPIMEVTQFKGDSESHPLLSPTDEFAGFETWNGWGGPLEPKGARGKVMDPVSRKRGEYARSALKTGLDLEEQLGVNPFKYGLIGSTDSHTSLSTADNDNFWGKFPREFPRAQLRRWHYSAAGYAAVWAVENTREAIFAAMKRREVYATTGPRIIVRFFGGWEYAPDDAARPDLARAGYAGGVPMGGDLANAPAGKAPRFLVQAARDPVGANLDRVQVIKGWRDEKGKLQERVYDVALSDGRRSGRTGQADPVGNTVDVKNATYTNRIGDPELAVVWTDPDFDRNERAFYYLRVLAIPTPRWTAYDAKLFSLKDLPENIPMITQERAYSSPIWYNPE